MPLDWSNGIVHQVGGTVSNVGDVLDSLQASITALNGVLNAPSGTRMLFQQTAAPTGWTKDTTHNNKALRLVSGTAGSGGSTPFTTVFASRTIAQANLPNVTLTVTGTVSSTTTISNGTSVVRNTGSNASWVGPASAFFAVSDITASTTSTFSGGATSSLNGGVTQAAIDFSVQYVDFIIATKV